MTPKYKIIGHSAIGRYIKEHSSMYFATRFPLEDYKPGLKFGTDYTYFFTAGMSKPQDCEDNPELLAKTIDGTVKYIRDIAKENRVIFFSSDVVLGSETAYSKSKKDIEKAILRIPNVRVVRLSYVFSDVEWFEDPFTKYAIQEEGPVEVYSDLKRNIIHIKDVFDGLVYIGANWALTPPIINLVGKHSIDKSSLLKYINKEYSIIDDKEKINKFFEHRDKVIEIEPNFYMPKIDLKGTNE